jgi:hypothetical protein
MEHARKGYVRHSHLHVIAQVADGRLYIARAGEAVLEESGVVQKALHHACTDEILPQKRGEMLVSILGLHYHERHLTQRSYEPTPGPLVGAAHADSDSGPPAFTLVRAHLLRAQGGRARHIVRVGGSEFHLNLIVDTEGAEDLLERRLEVRLTGLALAAGEPHIGARAALRAVAVSAVHDEEGQKTPPAAQRAIFSAVQEHLSERREGRSEILRSNTLQARQRVRTVALLRSSAVAAQLQHTARALEKAHPQRCPPLVYTLNLGIGEEQSDTLLATGIFRFGQLYRVKRMLLVPPKKYVSE